MIIKCPEHGNNGRTETADGIALGKGLRYCPSGGGHEFTVTEPEYCWRCEHTSGMRMMSDDKLHQCDHAGGCKCPVCVEEREAQAAQLEQITEPSGHLPANYPQAVMTADRIYIQRHKLDAESYVMRMLFHNRGNHEFTITVLCDAEVIIIPDVGGDDA